MKVAKVHIYVNRFVKLRVLVIHPTIRYMKKNREKNQRAFGFFTCECARKRVRFFWQRAGARARSRNCLGYKDKAKIQRV